jgi:uncharacterized protein (TIGR02246 family)
MSDEQAIRTVVSTWIDATKKGDFSTVLSLMSDDVLFLVPGQEPFGKAAFAANAGKMKDMRIEATSDIRELDVLGDWAWIRNRLRVVITPPNGTPIVRSGHTLTILQKTGPEKWVVTRDANLVVPEVQR